MYLFVRKKWERKFSFAAHAKFLHDSPSQSRKVPNVDDGMRLDKFLRKNFGFPQSLIEKFVRKNKISLNPIPSEKITSKYRIRGGQTVVITGHISESPPQSKEKITLPEETISLVRSWIIHKDPDLIVLNKPPGVVVQGSKQSIVQMLPALQFDSASLPFLVHRLDKETSGILLVARNRKIAEILANDFKTQKIQKLYWAIVVGTLKNKQGISRTFLAEKVDENFVYVAKEDSGASAATAYTVLDAIGNEASNKFSFLELRPFTGRKHQLRVQCASCLQTPILGDKKYGVPNPSCLDHLDVNGLQLHARELLLVHPTTKKPLNFICPPPKHMRNAINSIGFTIQTKALNPTLIPRNENEIQAIKKNDKKKKIYQRDTKFKAKSFIKAKKNGTKKVKNTKKLSKSKKSSKSQKFRE